MEQLKSMLCIFGLYLALFTFTVFLRQNEILRKPMPMPQVKIENDKQVVKLLILAYPR